MPYLNTTQGARAIRLTTGGHVLVEPGATVDVDESKVARIAPGLVKVPVELPPVPAELVEAIASAEPAKPARRPRRKAG